MGNRGVGRGRGEGVALLVANCQVPMPRTTPSVDPCLAVAQCPAGTERERGREREREIVCTLGHAHGVMAKRGDLWTGQSRVNSAIFLVPLWVAVLFRIS